MTALDLRAIARALGGEVSGQQVLAPGPQHSPKDRSLCVSLAPAMPGGFLVHSFAGDDPIQCKDYVLTRLCLPAWQPGDEQDRRVHLSRIKDWDRTIAGTQATLRERTEDDLLRIKRAQALWNEAADPRGTMAVQYLMVRALDLADDLAGAVLRFHPRCPWRNEDAGKTERIPALLAAFRSIDGDDITAVHRIPLDQPQRWPKADRRMLGLVHRAAVKQGLLTLQRKRTGGNQQVTVKHIHQQVNVTQGGQAVVAGDKIMSRTRGRRRSDGGGTIAS